MKKLLFIVNESRSANGICTKAVMKACVQQGYRVSCITNREYGDPVEYTADEITYYTVKPRWHYRVNSYLDNGRIKGTAAKLLRALNTCMNKAKLLVSCPSWPLISPAFAKRIYKRAKALCLDDQVDGIIPVYTQIDTLIAAARIKKEMPRVRYIPYFLDSFSGGYGPKIFSKEWTIKRGLKWEAKLLPGADLIIMMQSARAHYEKYSAQAAYFDRIRFLDLPLFSPALSVPQNQALPEKDVIDLVYVGSIPAHIRNPKYFLQLFRLIKDDRLRFTIIGNSTCDSLLKEMAGADTRIRLLPAVDHEAALSAMQAADILVNFGNNNPLMTPSKIFEYMSFGKPILSTAPIEDEPSLVYLKDYPQKFVIHEDREPAAQAAAVHAFINEACGKRVDAAVLKRQFYLNTPDAWLETVLEEVMRS